ncbi:SMI1/KNR4 family protein [Ruminococcus sp.]|uniref:SMI1/KNR4 family protein n=1 Tax=Ruminococcus sp. TaxID=41978 RepID=UPI003867F5FA
MWSEFEFNDPYQGTIPEIMCGLKLPTEYIEFMKRHNGGEGDTGESWLVIFPIEELESVNNDYKEYLPDGNIIIGSNGSGELFGLNKDGQYFIVPIIIEEEYMEIIGDSIENLPADINRYWREL